MRGLWPFLGPAFIAAVAYIDPGNFATNIAGGAKYGYLLCWVVVSANLMAMLVQTLSRSWGSRPAATCRRPAATTFADRCRSGSGSRRSVAMATDLAQFLGAALGLYLLFGIPLFPAGALAGAGRLRDPCLSALRVSPPRGGDRRARRRHRSHLRLRSSSREADPWKPSSTDVCRGSRDRDSTPGGRHPRAQRSCRSRLPPLAP